MTNPPPDSAPDPAPEQAPKPAHGESPTDTDGNPPGAASPGQVQNASKADVVRFVTTIKNAQTQIGEHIMQALQHDDTVAVLTSVVVGPGGQQHLVSAAVKPNQLAAINQLLTAAQQEREEEEPCVGFHCLIKPKPDSDSQT